MSAFADWLLALVKDIFKAAWDFLSDIFISILELFLQGFLTLITAIPVPSFVTSGLGSALSGIPSDVWYFAGHFKFAQCFAILGAAFTFRLLRKVVTLFQW